MSDSNHPWTDRDQAGLRREFVKLLDEERKSAVQAERRNIAAWMRRRAAHCRKHGAEVQADTLEGHADVIELGGLPEEGEHL